MNRGSMSLKEFHALTGAVTTLAVAKEIESDPNSWFLTQSIVLRTVYVHTRKPMMVSAWIDGPVCDLLDLLCNQIDLEKPAQGLLGPENLALLEEERVGAPSAHQVIAATRLVEKTLADLGLPEERIAQLIAFKE